MKAFLWSILLGVLLPLNLILFQNCADISVIATGKENLSSVNQDGFVKLYSGAQADGICALDLSNNLYCWGRIEQYGGTGEVVRVPQKIVLPDIEDTIIDVTLARHHTCALTESQKLYCWGDNSSRQFGDPNITRTFHSQPQLIQESLTQGFQSLISGTHFTCAKLQSGQAKCTRVRGPGPAAWDNLNILDTSTPIESISFIQSGTEHLCASTTSPQKLYCSGLRGMEEYTLVGIGNIVQLAVGQQHICLRNSNNRVFCFGQNWHGQLGRPASVSQDQFLQIENLNESVAEIATGGFHTCARTQNKTVFCWGLNEFEQTGKERLGTTSSYASHTATRLPIQNVKQVVAGHNHSCALTESGEVYCWGSNLYGQLGIGDSTLRHTHIPQKISQLRE